MAGRIKLKRAGLLLVALLLATVVGGAVASVVDVLWTVGWDDPLRWGFSDLFSNMVLEAVLSLPFALLFWVLGSPFLLVRRWIVGDSFPFIRLGYVGVILYGPLLLWLIAPGSFDYWRWVTLYEVVAIVASVLFAIMAKTFLSNDEIIA